MENDTSLRDFVSTYFHNEVDSKKIEHHLIETVKLIQSICESWVETIHQLKNPKNLVRVVALGSVRFGVFEKPKGGSSLIAGI